MKYVSIKEDNVGVGQLLARDILEHDIKGIGIVKSAGLRRIER